MANKCKKCDLAVGRTKKGVNCAHCGDVFHVSCGQISDHTFKDIEAGTIDWRCNTCRSKRKSIINIGMERKNSTSIEPDHSNISSNISLLTDEMKSLRLMQQSVLNTMEKITDKIAELEVINAKVLDNEKRIKVLENDNKTLKNVVKSMSIRLDNAEQRSFSNKIQINNVPASINKCAKNIFTDIAQKIDLNISMDEIIDVSMSKRMIKPQISSDKGNDNEVVGNASVTSKMDNETASIVVHFKSINMKKEFLRKYRLNRNVFFDSEKQFKIFVNEILSSSRRRLYKTAKLFCKENNFDYVWISNGSIFIRKSEGRKAYRIDASTDFAKIGGLNEGEC